MITINSELGLQEALRQPETNVLSGELQQLAEVVGATISALSGVKTDFFGMKKLRVQMGIKSALEGQLPDLIAVLQSDPSKVMLSANPLILQGLQEVYRGVTILRDKLPRAFRAGVDGYVSSLEQVITQVNAEGVQAEPNELVPTPAEQNEPESGTVYVVSRQVPMPSPECTEASRGTTTALLRGARGIDPLGEVKSQQGDRSRASSFASACSEDYQDAEQGEWENEREPNPERVPSAESLGSEEQVLNVNFEELIGVVIANYEQCLNLGRCTRDSVPTGIREIGELIRHYQQRDIPARQLQEAQGALLLEISQVALQRLQSTASKCSFFRRAMRSTQVRHFYERLAHLSIPYHDSAVNLESLDVEEQERDTKARFDKVRQWLSQDLGGSLATEERSYNRQELARVMPGRY